MTAILADSSEIHLQPKAERATFHYRGDVRDSVYRTGLSLRREC